MVCVSKFKTYTRQQQCGRPIINYYYYYNNNNNNNNFIIIIIIIMWKTQQCEQKVDTRPS